MGHSLAEQQIGPIDLSPVTRYSSLVTKYGLLNPLTPMFYTIFIRKSWLLPLLTRQQMTTICITYKGIEKPGN